jgi:WD40 repeat protein
VVIERSHPDAVLRTFSIKGFDPRALVFADSGRTLVLGSAKKYPSVKGTPPPDSMPTIEAWDVEKAQERFAVSTGIDYSSSIGQLATDGALRTISAGRLGGLSTLSLQTGTVVREDEYGPYDGERDYVRRIAIDSSTGSTAIVYGPNRVMWHRRGDSKDVNRLPTTLEYVQSVAWWRGGRRLVVSGIRSGAAHARPFGCVEIMDVMEGKTTSWRVCDTEVAVPADVFAAVVTVDATNRLVTSGDDGTIREWSVQ